MARLHFLTYWAFAIQLLILRACVFAGHENWAKDFVFGSREQRRALRGKILTEQGLNFCASAPEAPTTANNLASGLSWDGIPAESLSEAFGTGAIKTATIQDKDEGPELSFSGLSAGHYEFSVWAKIENLQEANILAARRSSGQEVNQGSIIATALAKSNCWTKVVGGFTLLSSQGVVVRMGGLSPGTALILAAVYIGGVNQTDYYIRQNALISQIRKRAVVLNIVDSAGKPYTGFVELDQTDSDFGFGGMVNAGFLNSKSYQQWFQKRFSWAVHQVEAEWWKTEPVKGQYQYFNVDEITRILLRMNISIRGHAVLLGEAKASAPAWIANLTSTALVAAVQQHVKDIVTRFKGKFLHWDVLNEPLRNTYYPNATKDPYFASVVHKAVKAVDPNVLNFVNDYNIVEAYSYAPSTPERLLAVVANITAHGGPVDRIGVEGHFAGADGPRIRYELDMLATGGYPVWFTELQVYWTDNELQADLFEVILREAFSHPVMEGIVLWEPYTPGCLDDDPNCKNSIVNGNFIERPIGLRYLKLRKEWSTHRREWVKNGVMSFRGFFGKYRMRAHNSSGKVLEQVFSVPKASTTLRLTVQLPK